MSQQQPPAQPGQPTWQPGYPPAPPAPQPERKGWFARHKILSGLLVLGLLGIVISAMGGGGDERTSASPGSGAGAAVAEPAAKQAKPGTPVRDGSFEFTVTKVQAGVAAVGSDVFGEKAQGQFVLVHVTVTNIGTEAQLLMDSAQTVFDAKGRKFSPDTAAALHIKGNDVFINEINPGNTVKGVLVFDMPTDARAASIELHDSAFSGGVSVALG